MDNDLHGGIRIAVLIDADNTSAKYAEALLEEVAKYGTPTIKRAYGDFASPHLKGWITQLNARAIRSMHQTAFTTGKNSTDSALIIDAMDLLYADNVEAFAIVSSDSDFTSLALRLRESGKKVYGLGRKTTPSSLQNACDRFIALEVLLTEGNDDPEPATEKVGDDAPSINLQSALTKAVNATADEEGWTSLSAIGQHLRRTHASFDPRSWGAQNLNSLIAEQGYLQTTGSGNASRIALKGHAKKAAAKKTTAAKKVAAAQSRTQDATSEQPPAAVQPTVRKRPARKTAAKKSVAAEAPPATEPPPAPSPAPTVTVTTRTRGAGKLTPKT